jgi:hypothetical protein
MSLLTRLNLSPEYETAAVIDNQFVCGGVRDSAVPNYVYRWTEHEVEKVASSCLAERPVRIVAYPSWDFNIDEHTLDMRADTRLGSITKVVGTARFLTILRTVQRFMNATPVLRRQGNKFFAVITTIDELRPWLTEADGRKIVFDRAYVGRAAR